MSIKKVLHCSIIYIYESTGCRPWNKGYTPQKLMNWKSKARERDYYIPLSVYQDPAWTSRLALSILMPNHFKERASKTQDINLYLMICGCLCPPSSLSNWLEFNCTYHQRKENLHQLWQWATTSERELPQQRIIICTQWSAVVCVLVPPCAM